MKNLLLNRIAFLLLVSLLCSQRLFAQKTYKLGMIRNDSKYMSLIKRSPEFKMLRGILPPSFSLKSYLPPVGNQGDFSTCVGWATAYYMRTVMQAKLMNAKTPEAALAIAFSPTYIFDRIKRPTDIQCQLGTNPWDALDLLKKTGVATLKSVPYGCGTQLPTDIDAEASNFKIEGYSTLFELHSTTSTEDRVLAIKTALYESQNPVIIGMMIPQSFFKATDTWKAAPNESIEKTLGGHALTIIGYDSAREAFLIVNSWGDKWGSGGLTWANCKDVVAFTPYAFQIISPIIAPKPEPTPTPVTPAPVTPTPVTPVAQVSLKGSIKPILNSGESMPVRVILERGLDVTKDTTSIDMITYNTTQEYTSGTSFKTVISNNLTSYVYILASDDVNRVSKLFPYEEGISTLIPSNNEATLPAANSSFTMDNKPGNDYFLVLYSTKELDLDKISEDIKKAPGAESDFKQKVFSVIGKDFVPYSSISYDTEKIAFEVKGTPKGTIVPLLVKIKHK
ncbi:MAG: C1 family peptidase [Flectobacillus sp.]|nr:C1 family peptidase [Flectobacillus sp.]